MPLVGCGLSIPFPQKDLALHLPVGSESHRLSRGFSVCFGFERLFYIQSPCQTPYVAKEDLELLALWPLPPECWGHKCASLHLASLVVNTEAGFLHTRQGCSIPEPHPGLLTAISNPVLCSTPGYSWCPKLLAVGNPKSSLSFPVSSLDVNISLKWIASVPN